MDYLEGGSDEDYGFDYEDDGSDAQGGDADVENQYYTAKCKLDVSVYE